MNIRLAAPLTFLILVLAGFILAEDTPIKKNPPERKPVAKQDSAAKSEIIWHKYDEGLALAKKQSKKVFVEFTAKWCGYCKKMHATTFRDPEIIRMLNDYYVSVTVDGDSPDTLNIDGWMTTENGLTREYRVSGYPTYWFLTPEAERIAPVKGYRDKVTLGYILDYLKDDLYKTVTFEDYMKEKQKR